MVGLAIGAPFRRLDLHTGHDQFDAMFFGLQDPLIHLVPGLIGAVAICQPDGTIDGLLEQKLTFFSGPDGGLALVSRDLLGSGEVAHRVLSHWMTPSRSRPGRSWSVRSGPQPQ